MITAVQYQTYTNNKIAFGNKIAEKAFLKGKSVIQQTKVHSAEKQGLFGSLKDMFFEMFPNLDSQYRKQMANVKSIDKLV